MYQVNLVVTPRPGVRDPQGEAVEEALRGIGHDRAHVHRVGRVLQLDVDAPNEAQARSLVEDMCKRLLVNPSLETYEITLRRVESA